MLKNYQEKYSIIWKRNSKKNREHANSKLIIMFVKRYKTNYDYHHEMLCFMLLSHGSFISSVLFD